MFHFESIINLFMYQASHKPLFFFIFFIFSFFFETMMQPAWHDCCAYCLKSHEFNAEQATRRTVTLSGLHRHFEKSSGAPAWHFLHIYCNLNALNNGIWSNMCVNYDDRGLIQVGAVVWFLPGIG